MNTLIAPQHQNNRTPLHEINDRIERFFALNKRTQLQAEEINKYEPASVLALNEVKSRIAAIQSEPYYREDEVSENVFKNSFKTAEYLLDFIHYLQPEDIGTSTYGTLTFDLHKDDSKIQLSIDIGEDTLAYFLTDQKDLFISGEEAFTNSSLDKIYALLKDHFAG